MADDDRRRTRPGAPVNRGYDAQTQGTLSGGAQQAVAPGSSGYPASVADPSQPGASYASPSGYPASNQLSGDGSTLASIAASSIPVGPPSAVDVRQVTPVDAATANVRAAADAYRALPLDATPVQRAAAMQDYQNSLYDKRAALTPSVNEGRPEAYNRFLLDHGINPDTIGSAGARMREGGGMVVPTVDQEYAARNLAEQGVRRVAALQRAGQGLRFPRGRERGDIEAGEALNARAMSMAKEYGLVNPFNPQAGFNMDYATRQQLETGNLARALQRDPSTLASLANRPVQPVSDELSRIAAANSQQAARDWEEQMARRQAFTY